MINTTDDNEEKRIPEEPAYNFGIGHPSNSLNLPSEFITKYIGKLTNKDNIKDYNEVTGYAISEGSWHFRSNLSDWLNKLNAMNKDENDKKYSQTSGTNMVLTTGASQSMELLLIHLKTLKNKTNSNCKNIVLCADPSYFLFPNIVETANCKLLPIPFINNALDFSYLQTILEKYNNDIICFYIIPSHQNPLGISYNINDKIALIKLCHKYKIHIIADEVYNLLSFDADRMMIPFLSSIEKTLVDQENEENEEKEKETEFFCHSISSLSKIIGPGFRLGWIMSHNENILNLINNHGSIRSGGNMTNFVPSLLAYSLDPNNDENDLTKHLIKVRNGLSENCKCLCDTIRKHDTQKIIKFNEPKGGYFVWLQLPTDKIKIISPKVKYFDGKKLSSTFGPISKNIQFVDESGNDVGNRQEYFDKCIRLCFAFLDQQQIHDGVRLFVQSMYNE